MNSLTAYALAHEMDETLPGATISKITHYPACFTLELRDRRVPYLHLLYSGRSPELIPSRSRIASDAPGTPVASVIAGGSVRRIEPLGMDRIILLSAELGGTWSGAELCTVRFDMTPAALPLAIFKTPGDRLSECHGPSRAKKPSSPTDLPPARPLSLLALPAVPSDRAIAESRTEDWPADTPGHTRGWLRIKRTARLLTSLIGGMDPVLSAALSRAFEGDLESIWPHLVEIGSACVEKRFSWRRYEFPEEGEAGRCTIYPVPLPVGSDGTVLADAFEAVEERWREVIKPSYVEYLRKRILASVDRDLRRSRRLAQKLAADLEDANRAREYRQYGNLLVTYRHLLRRGMKKISVRDFSGEGTVTIPLSPEKNPEQNIRRYFGKAKKGEKGALIISGRKRETERGIAESRRLAERIARYTEPDELIPIVPKRRDSRRDADRPTAEPPFKRFVIEGRYVAYVGRKDRENDLLTHRFAAPDDLWLHAQGVSGSHVILKNAGQPPPKRIVEKAAAIAAYFSKARYSSTVPVIYTEKRYVRKPRKSPPGTASCLRGKTIYVEPSVPEPDREKNQ